MNKSHLGLAIVSIAIMSGCGAADTDTVSNAVQDLNIPADTQERAIQEQRNTNAVSVPEDEDAAELDITFEDLQRGAKVELLDVSGGTASGTAWTTQKNGKTYHRVVAKDMPVLEAGYFYEGWLVKNPALGQFFSTGEMTQEASGEWLLEYTHDSDVTDYEKVVITLEPNDGDPAPAAHIIEN